MNMRIKSLIILICFFAIGQVSLQGQPVKAELVNCPEDYRYSSAIDYAGGKGLLKVEIVK